jgi:predicted DCC family thiol-disulfide oxidoreductase YuxK
VRPDPDAASSTPAAGGVLLYDSDCGFCTRSAEFLRRRRPGCEIRPMTDAALAGFGVDAERARREVPFVDAAGVRWGADAVAAALATCPGGWRAAGWLIGRPPLAWVARPVYAWVAAHRHELPGGTASCELPR